MTLFSPYSSYLRSKDIRTTLFSRPLGRRRKSLALLAVGGGLLTFFVPLITIDPPVLETNHWSAFSIVTSMYEGKLSQPVCERCGEPLIRSLLALPIEVSVVYLLFGFSLVALCFSQSSKMLAVLGSVGSMVCLNSGYAATWAFEETFYGRIMSRVRHVHDWEFVTVLLALMLSIVYVSLKESLDPAPSSSK
jgi:hypothetical protein